MISSPKDDHGKNGEQIKEHGDHGQGLLAKIAPFAKRSGIIECESGTHSESNQDRVSNEGPSSDGIMKQAQIALCGGQLGEPWNEPVSAHRY